jgi:glucose/arabinose dehydrogenase
MLNRPSRSFWLALATASLLFQTVVGSAAAVTDRGARTASLEPQAVANSLEVVETGFSHPVLVTHAGDSSGRLFVVEQTGRIKIIDGGKVRPTPFLDLSGSVLYRGERGLLGLAFHPSYETNGKFYVNFITKSGHTAINEYRVSSDPDVANRASGRRILTIAQPYSNHNGGHLAFGPNGYLFIGMGDGGGAGDPGNRAQSVNSLLGKMLRIDVNGTSGTRQYRIPATNPYVGKAGLDEIYSRGLRNPWRWSFDRATMDLWIGDVGQSRYEEIDRSTSTSGRGRGANYGWKVMEGRACYSPSSGCNTSGKVLPVVAYNHSKGDCSVIGGYVYRGPSAPSLVGRYLFGDFCSGRIWSIARAAAAPAGRGTFLDTDLNITSFGEDEAGEVYVTDAGGGVRRIVAP